jgi:phage terminase large subunit GpA-like protein
MTQSAAAIERIPPAGPRLAAALSRALAPRRPLTVSQWADANRVLSPKASPESGPWRTSRNPPLREIMDSLSARVPVREVVARMIAQFGKSEIGTNFLGYIIDHAPGPTMVVLPGDVSRSKWVNQKLNPLIEETACVHDAIVSHASRNSANTRDFKDFRGGQLYMEHAGSPLRLVQTSAKYLIVDEVDKFAAALRSGDDPLTMLRSRYTAFTSSYKALWIGTPEMVGGNLDTLYDASDRRRYYVPCPHCGHEQELVWKGLQYTSDGKAWYVCRENGCVIEEHHKTTMIAAGRWVAENPGVPVRGYTINGLYYPIGLGPRWSDLAREWMTAQGDNAKLKTFLNERMAEPWEDQRMRKVKHNVLADRAEPYRLRQAPLGVLALTVGVDTQDDRLAVQFVGWGRNMAAWTLDYIELSGDPAEDEVWVKLVDLVNRPIESAYGGLLRVDAGLIDAGGHRTEAVKAFVRRRLLRRFAPIYGAKLSNAPVLSKGRLQDINWRGQLDKRGITTHHVGTVAIKDELFGRLSRDADREPADRQVHFSEELDRDFFQGMVSETFNPTKGRYEQRGSARNEPLDTWVYAYAATHHPELRLHRMSKAEWDAREARLRGGHVPRETPSPGPDEAQADVPRETSHAGTPELRPPSTRGALDAIVSRIQRTPLSECSAADLAYWSAATGGTADEQHVLAVILDKLRDSPGPMVANVPSAIFDRARRLLAPPPPVNVSRRPRRGVRNAGLS